jgi:eukaryotic-like serine/threonine-protein kinase
VAIAISSYDWSANLVRAQHGWIAHVLRREADTLILPNAPALMEGSRAPGKV